MSRKATNSVSDFYRLHTEFSKTNSISPYEPISTSMLIDWVCPIGHEYTSQFGNRIKGSNCPYCSNSKLLPGFNDFATKYPDLAKEWSAENKLSPSEVSPGFKQKVKWVCDKGHTYEDSPNHRTSSSTGCYYCSGRRVLPGFNDLKTTRPDLVKLWADKSVSPEEVTSGSTKIVDWKCLNGHQFSLSVKQATRKKNACSVCSGKKVVSGFNDLFTLYPNLKNEIEDIHLIKDDPLFRSSGKKVRWVCSAGHQWEATPSDRTRLDNPTGCPKCSNQKSKSEEELFEYVQSIYMGQVLSRDKNLIAPYELDIVIPDLGIGIEFNGLYWHSDKYKDTRYHKNKSDYALSKGIRIIHVWEDQWEFSRKTVKRMLRHKLGLSFEKIFARKTKVDPKVSIKESREFLNNYHIQGSTSGSLRVGLRDQSGSLVALSVFKKCGDVLRLERYATKLTVVGGHSKIISYLDKNIDYSLVETFADLSVSDGNLYGSTGWTKVCDIDIDYMYVYRGRRVHKFNFRKIRFKNDPDLLFKEGLTERELSELNNIPRIWDCGKTKYVRKKNGT